MIDATVRGNVLANPVQRIVLVGQEERYVTELAVMSTVLKRKSGSHTEWEEDKEKTQPVEITFWNEKKGKQIMDVVRKGMAVTVEVTSLHAYLFKPNHEQVARGMKEVIKVRCIGEDLNLSLQRVESVTMKPTRAAVASSASGETGREEDPAGY